MSDECCHITRWLQTVSHLWKISWDFILAEFIEMIMSILWHSQAGHSQETMQFVPENQFSFVDNPLESYIITTCRFKSNEWKTHPLRNNNKELSETERVSDRQWTWKRRARREISHQTAGPDPRDECSVDGRIILHNKCFKSKPVIDSWSQATMCSHHTWILGSCQSSAATGGGIMIVIWQLSDLM